jgi:hypothetical protein
MGLQMRGVDHDPLRLAALASLLKKGLFPDVSGEPKAA